MQNEPSNNNTSPKATTKGRFLAIYITSVTAMFLYRLFSRLEGKSLAVAYLAYMHVRVSGGYARWPELRFIITMVVDLETMLHRYMKELSKIKTGKRWLLRQHLAKAIRLIKKTLRIFAIRTKLALVELAQANPTLAGDCMAQEAVLDQLVALCGAEPKKVTLSEPAKARRVVRRIKSAVDSATKLASIFIDCFKNISQEVPKTAEDVEAATQKIKPLISLEKKPVI